MKLLIIILSLSIGAFAQTIKCDLNNSSTINFNNTINSFVGDVKTNEEIGGTLIITGVYTDKPTLIGNIGSQILYQIGISITGDIIQLIEPKGSGLVNLITYDKHKNILYYTKQYSFGNSVSSYIYFGKCVDYN